MRDRGPTGRLLALPGPRRLVVVCGLLGLLTDRVMQLLIRTFLWRYRPAA